VASGKSPDWHFVYYIKYFGTSRHTFIDNGIEIGTRRCVHDRLDPGFGSHVYSALDKFDPNGRREWISTASFGAARAPEINELAKRVTIHRNSLNTRGLPFCPDDLIVTDVRVSGRTRSGSGFRTF